VYQPPRHRTCRDACIQFGIGVPPCHSVSPCVCLSFSLKLPSATTAMNGQYCAARSRQLQLATQVSTPTSQTSSHILEIPARSRRVAHAVSLIFQCIHALVTTSAADVCPLPRHASTHLACCDDPVLFRARAACHGHVAKRPEKNSNGWYRRARTRHRRRTCMRKPETTHFIPERKRS